MFAAPPAPARRLGAVLALVLAVPLLAGCGAADGAHDGRPRVVASFYPLQYVAHRVAGDHAKVENLTVPGAEPHDLELSVPQVAEIADADVVLYEQGFQPAVDQAVEQNGPEHQVEVTDVVDLRPADGDDDTLDPHFWLDPDLLLRVAGALREDLAAVDPDHAADYRRNLAALRQDLRRLDEDYARGLADCRTDTVVVSHDAFGYLSKYGLRFVSIAGLSPDAEPSPDHVAQLHDLVDSAGITTVFSETLASPEMARALADDAGVRSAVLDPIEGLGEQTADEDYLSLMRANLAALRRANRCAPATAAGAAS